MENAERVDDVRPTAVDRTHLFEPGGSLGRIEAGGVRHLPGQDAKEGEQSRREDEDEAHQLVVEEGVQLRQQMARRDLNVVVERVSHL